MKDARRTIAREWLLLVALLIVGATATVFIYFPTSSQHVLHRLRLYDDLTKQYKTERIWQQKQSRYNFQGIPKAKQPQSSKPDIFDILWDDEVAADTSHPLGTFDSFSSNLDDPSKRRTFYDSVSAKYDIGNYSTFEAKTAPPSFFSRVFKFTDHLFTRWYWLQTWFSVLTPYLLILFARSLVWSIKTLKRR